MEIRLAIPSDVDELVELWLEFMDYHCALDSGFVRAPGASAKWADYISSKLVGQPADFDWILAGLGKDQI